MLRSVWEALENNGDGVVSDWNLPSAERAKLETKLDMLAGAEVDPAGKVNLPSGMIVGPHIHKQTGIYKLIVNGNQALRPMICLGPTANDKEWTVLARARKQDNNTGPEKAAAVTATTRRAEILGRTRKRKIFIEIKP